MALDDIDNLLCSCAVTCYKSGVTKVSQGCHKVVTRVSQGCHLCCLVAGCALYHGCGAAREEMFIVIACAVVRCYCCVYQEHLCWFVAGCTFHHEGGATREKAARVLQGCYKDCYRCLFAWCALHHGSGTPGEEVLTGPKPSACYAMSSRA
jgi:hypothetical protein